MKPKIVRPAVIATVVARVAKDIAVDLEGRSPKEDRDAARETRLRSLMEYFELGEAIALIKMLVEPRLRCASCARVVPYRRASGDQCLDCARASRAEQEAKVPA